MCLGASSLHYDVSYIFSLAHMYAIKAPPVFSGNLKSVAEPMISHVGVRCADNALPASCAATGTGILIPAIARLQGIGSEENREETAVESRYV